MDVFFYIKHQDVERVSETGLKLNEWSDRKISIKGIWYPCIHALLNPMDEPEKFHDDNYIPLKIHVDPKHSIVAEGLFYNDFFFNSEMNKLYNKSVMLFEKYTFGIYRRPECLLTGTVSNKYFTQMDKLIDVPILYGSSEEIYLNRQLQAGRDSYENFEEKLLYRFYHNLYEKGLYEMYTTADSDHAVFESSVGEHIISTKKR